MTTVNPDSPNSVMLHASHPLQPPLRSQMMAAAELPTSAGQLEATVKYEAQTTSSVC